MLVKLKIFYFILVCNHGIGGFVAQQSLRFGEKGDSGHVININCGGPSQGHGTAYDVPRNPGAPGKVGPVGPIGPKGNKGMTGSRGEKGETGREQDVEEIKSDILGMLSVTSCGELMSKYGVNKTGYYQMREGNKAVYNYCDFNYYAGVHTCKQLQDLNVTTTSGVYSLSFQGNAYQVHCNFSSGAAITEVWHSSMEEVKASPECEDPKGCYSWSPGYNLPERDILRIIEISQTCRQFIKARCKGMRLLYNNSPYGWWVSRQGEKMLYWGGATSRRDGYCSCGETGSCLDNSYKCNCDQNSGDVITADEGFITDKSKLPVREIRLADMGASSEDGWHTLGKLECMG